MPSATPGHTAARSIVVVRALAGMGDMLCAIPALRSLRAGIPEAHVTLVGLPCARGIVERFPGYIDELVAFPSFPGIPEVPLAPEALPPFLEAMQARRFDLAIQLHGSGFASNPFTMLLGAAETAGFYLPAQYRPEGAFIPYPDGVHELQRLNALTRSLGMPDMGEHLEWPVTEADRAELARTAEGRLGKTYAVVHAGANANARRWPPDRFASAADRIAAEGVQVVLTGVPGDEPVTSAVAASMRSAPLDLTGRTSLGALGALVAGARMVLCNDTGVSHLAAALRVPSVVVFSESEPRRWAPLDRRLHLAVCADAPPVGLEAVTAAVERRLRREGERVA